MYIRCCCCCDNSYFLYNKRTSFPHRFIAIIQGLHTILDKHHYLHMYKTMHLAEVVKTQNISNKSNLIWLFQAKGETKNKKKIKNPICMLYERLRSYTETVYIESQEKHLIPFNFILGQWASVGETGEVCAKGASGLSLQLSFRKSKK